MSTYNLELQEIQSAYFGHECFSIFTAVIIVPLTKSL